MTGWLLLDYGQVLSTPPPPDEWDALRRAAGPAGRDPDGFHRLYWQDRIAYDRGDLTVDEYWERVAPDGAQPALRTLDVAMWLHPHRPTVEAAVRAKQNGWRLAILSNAPVEVAKGIDALGWLEPFERRFYSCELRAVKPERAVYAHVLADLGVTDPARVVFFDDRPENVEAAVALGLDARLFTDAAEIDRIGPGSG
jgi:putative hydrolase of the HAD superfamily